MSNAVYPFFKAWKANGSSPASSYLLYTYESGTTNPKTTYSDAALTTPNTNPIVLNANGEATIFLGTGSYRFDLKTPAGSLVNTFDPLQGGSGVSVGSVATLTDLKALSSQGNNTYVEMLGYNTPGDGGGGVFYFDATSSETDNNGTIFSPASLPLLGRWKRLYSGDINVKWFGVKGDGTTDDTIAIGYANSFASSLTNGGTLFFPSSNGNYKYTVDLNFGTKVTVKMDKGAIFDSAGVTLSINHAFIADRTKHFTSTMGLVQFYPGVAPIVYPEWWGAYARKQVDTASDKTLLVQKACNAAGYLDTRRKVVLSDGYWDIVGLNVSQTTGSKVISLEGQNYSGTIIKRWSDTDHVIKCVNSTQVVGWQFRNFLIDGRNTSGAEAVSTTYDGIYTENIALCTFENVSSGSNRYGINLAINSVDITLIGCIFGSNNVHGVGCTSPTTTSNIRFIGCWFDENTTHGLYINCSSVIITGCQFLDNGASGYHLFCDNSSSVVIATGNTFLKGNTGDAIRIYGSNILIDGNYFDSYAPGKAATISNGTNNAVINNNMIATEFSDSTGVCAFNCFRGGFMGVGTLSGAPCFPIDINGNIRIQSSNKLYFRGNGASDNDVNLYGSAADTLKTDDALEVALGASFAGGNVLIDSVGRMALRTAIDTGMMHKIQTSALNGVNQYGQCILLTGSPEATTAIFGQLIQPGTAVSAFTCTNVYTQFLSGFTLGAGSAVINHYGLYVDDIIRGSTKNRAIKTGSGAVEFGDRILGFRSTSTSANDLTLGAGNLHNISGTTTINRIAVADWTAGSEITLELTSITVTHGTASGGGFNSIKLSGSANFVVGANGATLTLKYNGTDWVEIARTSF